MSSASNSNEVVQNYRVAVANDVFASNSNTLCILEESAVEVTISAVVALTILAL